MDLIGMQGSPSGSGGEESSSTTGGSSSTPGLGRPPGERDGYPLQCYCLENSTDRGVWQTTVNGVASSWAVLGN